jgi:hypothetical protein
MLLSGAVLFFFWHKRSGGGGWNGVVFLLDGVGLRFAFAEGLRKSNGQFCGGLAKSVTEKNNEGKGVGKVMLVIMLTF